MTSGRNQKGEVKMKKIAVIITVLVLLGTTSIAQASMTTIPANWWSNKSTSNNVHENKIEDVRLSDANIGFIEGTITLPHEAAWSITFDVRTDGNFNLPEEFVEITINSDFVSKIYNSPLATTYPILYSFFGDEFTYNFDFYSPEPIYHAHLIVGAGEVSAVPIPGAVWLLGSGLAGLAGIRTKRKKK